MPQPVSNTLTVVSGSLLANKISYVVDGQNRNYRGGYGGLSWMSEAEATNNVIFIGNTSTIGRGPADKPLFYPSFNTSQTNVIYAANTLPGSPRNFTTSASAYNWAVTNNFFINNSDNPIPRIDADGMFLCLDAEQASSFPQTGTSWYDLSGANYTVTGTNNPTWNYGNGKSYWRFDGVDDYFAFASTPPIAQNTYTSTVEIWAKSINNAPSFQVMFGGGVQNTNQGYYYGFRQDNANFMYAFYANDQDGPTPRDNRVWNHYVAVYNQATGARYRYFNGELLSPSQASGVASTSAYRFAIGAYNDPSSGVQYFYNGYISKVRGYSRELTQAEIKQNYFQGNIITSSLSYLWDANNIVSYEGSGTTVYNLTGSISGSLTNGTGYTYNNGGSWVFDGVDDYILLENSLISITPGNGNWTLSAWVKGPWSSAVNYPIVGNTSGGPVASGFGIYQNKIFYQNYDGNWQTHYGNTTLNPNTWYHLTWVNYAGASAALGTMKMYVNAVADSSTFNSYTTNGGPVNAIGSAYYGIYSGNIASVQWNIGTAFSDQQVAQQYEATKYKFQGATIPLNGLVLNLDATNKDSYPGTGTTWYDLSGNSNNGTLVNGTSWSPSGYMSTDAVDDYIQIADATSLRFTTGFTQVIWVKLNNTITDYYRNLFGKPNYVCYGMIVEWYGGNPILYDFLVGGNRNALGLNYPGSNWVMVAQSYNASGGSNNQIGYINGGASNVLYATRTGNVDINTEPMYIGQSGLSMNVGLALAYNRGLTLSELNQIYNATKTRFGF